MGSAKAKDFWTTAREQDSDGRSTRIVRFDSRQGSTQEKERLSARLGLAVPTAFTEQDKQRLIALEDRVAESVGERGRLMMVIDSFEKPMHREFIVYVEPALDSAALQSTLQRAFSELDVQVQVVPDPEWAFHQDFIDMLLAGPKAVRSRGRASLWLAKLRELIAPPPRPRLGSSDEGKAGEGSWKTGVLTDEADRGGQTIVVRLDTGLEPEKRDPRFDTRLGIAVPSKFRKKDLQRFEALEDWLIAEFAGRGVLALVMSGVDGTTFREFVCYVERDTEFAELHDRLQAAFRPFDVQMYAETDPDWEVYEELKAALYR